MSCSRGPKRFPKVLFHRIIIEGCSENFCVNLSPLIQIHMRFVYLIIPGQINLYQTFQFVLTVKKSFSITSPDQYLAFLPAGFLSGLPTFRIFNLRQSEKEGKVLNRRCKLQNGKRLKNFAQIKRKFFLSIE